MARAVKFGTAPGAPRAPRLVTPKEAAEFLGVPEGTLAQWRSQRRGPTFVKLEGRLVRYRLADLDQYIASHIVEPEDSLANHHA
jgi:excisionase family DNA binding protein